MVLDLPHSPNLASCDFFYLLILKFALNGQRFRDVEEIKMIRIQSLNYRTILNENKKKMTRSLRSLRIVWRRAL